MKTVVGQRDLVRALAVAGAITPKVSPSLITTHVRLAWVPGKLTAMGTNYESWAYRAVPATGDDVSDTAGEVIACVPADTLRSFVTTLPDEPVTLSIERRTARDPGALRVRCGRSMALFQGLPPTDFPLLMSNETDATVKFSMPAMDLVTMLRRTVDAVSQDSLRPYLNGVHLMTRDGNLIAEAASQAGMMRYTLPSPIATMPPIIIPTPAVETLVSLLLGPDDSVDLTYDPGWGWLGVSWREFRVQTRLLGNKYADLDANLPGEATTLVKCNGEELVLAVRRMLKLMEGKSRRIDLAFDKDRIEIRTAEPALCDGEDSIEADINGPACTRRIHAKVLIDALSKVRGRIHIDLAATSPDRFTVCEHGVPGWFAMPVGSR